jgi:hypothetical protein
MMRTVRGRSSLRPRAALALLASLVGGPVFAQFGPPPGPSGPAQEIAPIDLTGQWVSIVTEDWRFRMVTPAKNDFPGLPLNAAGRAAADLWDPARDEAEGNECRAYGAGGIMRMPARIRVSWQDESTLEIQIDAGRQTRLLNFGEAPEQDEPTWQGVSTAEWELHPAGGGGFGGFGRPPVNGTLKVVTTGMRAGYFRKNGVPYSEDAVLTEYFDVLTQHDGTVWMTVLSILDDPNYYTTSIITSTNFRRQANRSGWNPTPCRAQ